MPVRIYDITRKHGGDNKTLLAKAKEMGLNVKSPSSTIDKISAEALELAVYGKVIPYDAPPAGPTKGDSTRPHTEDIPQEPVSKKASVPAVEPEEKSAPEPVRPIAIASPVEVKSELPKPAPAQKENVVSVPEQTGGMTSVEPSREARVAAQSVATIGEKPLEENITDEREEQPREMVEIKQAHPAPKEKPAPSPVSPSAAPFQVPHARPSSPVPSRPVPAMETPQAPPTSKETENRLVEKGAVGGPLEADIKPGTIIERKSPVVRGAIGMINLPPKYPGKPVAPAQPPTPPPASRGGSNQGRPGAPGGRGFQPGVGGQQRTAGAPQPQPATAGRSTSSPGHAGARPPVNVSPDKIIRMRPPIVVKDLALKLNLKPFQIISDLMEMNIFANITQTINEDAAIKVSAKHGYAFEVEKRERGAGIVHAPVKKIEVIEDDKPEQLKHRPPIVTIMGHVDHGKTSLLDAIRKGNVAAGEAGGITQHIGAYTVEYNKQLITFLDTPGHEAFTAMRARGANLTDIVLLVVAADDGFMPQTHESLSHAQAANVTIIVVINKIDVPGADVMKVKKQLQEKNLTPEEWGGQTIVCEVSATKNIGVDNLLEMILLQSEVLELKANPSRPAAGNVVEAQMEVGRGATATVLVRKGTLKTGDPVIIGNYWGKVKALLDERGKPVKSAGPSIPVRVLGINGVPQAGDELRVMESEKEARDLSEERLQTIRTNKLEGPQRVTLENLFDSIAAGQRKTLNVVIKADVQGSVEAISESLRKIKSDKVSLEIIHAAVGTITESDVLLASASDALIIGFHTKADTGSTDLAKREGVQIRFYTIIYELIQEVEEAMAGLLDPITKEVVIGQAEVKQVFNLSKGGAVAGCLVTSGRLVRTGRVRLIRRKAVQYEGSVTTLKRFQDDVSEVRAGLECGLRLSNFSEFQPGDIIESYMIEKVAQKL